MRQYRDGAVFVRGVIDKVGHRRLQRRLDLARDPAAARRDRRPRGLGRAASTADRRSAVTGPRPGRRRHPPGRARATLADLRPGRRRARGCSGGADSLALAAAAAFEAPRAGLARSARVVVDHGLQAGSAAGRRAGRATSCARLGLDPVEVRDRSRSTRDRRRASRPPPATARYAALDAAADRHGAAAVLLGHTLDDQAETVLLGLARGPAPGRWPGCRPPAAASAARCSGVTRDDTCRGLRGRRASTSWDDPHNDDPAFTRVRVRRAAGRSRARARARASPRPWPAPPTCCAPTPTTSTAAADAAVAALGPQPLAGRRRSTGIPRAVRTRVLAAAARRGRRARRAGRLPAHVDALRRAGHRLARAGPGATCPGDLRVARSDGRVAIAPADRVD